MNTKLKSLLFFPLSLFLPLDIEANSASNLQQEQQSYQTRLDDLISDHIPGAILYVKTPEKEFWGSAGLSNLSTKEPMPIDGVMPNGSAGKKVTALLVAMLHEEGLLDMDAPVNSYLSKEYLAQIKHSDSMTIRQLLNHTSGIFEYNDSEDYAFFKAQFSDSKTIKTDELPLSFALNREAHFRPGESFSYSNTGYALVGVILKKILGKHPASAIRERILEPLEMTSSYSKAIERHEPALISGYFINDADPKFPLPLNVWIDMKKYIGNVALSDAPLASNAKDMATILRSIVNENTTISPSVRENMIGSRNLVDAWGPRFYQGSDFYYGLGVFVEDIGGQRLYHHGGTEFGYYTQNIYIPEQDTSITAFANCGVNERCEDDFQHFTLQILDSLLNMKR